MQLGVDRRLLCRRHALHVTTDILDTADAQIHAQAHGQNRRNNAAKSEGQLLLNLQVVQETRHYTHPPVCLP